MAVKEGRDVGVRGRLIGWGAILLAALSGVAQADASPAPPSPPPAAAQATLAPAPRPAIWLIEDRDTRIYLFGTVHVFPASLSWRSAALNRVIADADELVMETPDVSLDAPDQARMERLMAPMQLGKSVPILERVSAPAREPLRAALAATGLPLEAYDHMTTWGVAFMLTSAALRGDASQDASGTTEEVSGAEEVLGPLFRKSGRPISGVETMEQQLNVFASMPLGAQRRFLESTVIGEDGESGSDLSSDQWVNGDVGGIARQMSGLPPELYEALLTRRNRNWTAWLAQRMERPGTVLFAVGAGHLAGPDSVQHMLAERGIVARRIG